jgi:hypothetical protein
MHQTAAIPMQTDPTTREYRMKTVRTLLTAAAVAAALGLAGCGGGGGNASSSAPAAAPTGVMNVQLTDGPSDEFQHVWVTIESIAFHTSPNQVWTPSDASWVKYKLPAPITVDLSTLNNGTLDDVFAGLSLPVGTYRQIRFFFAGADDSLTTSALDTDDSTGAALQWNDQVEFLDGRNNWAITEAPLEIAYPTQGIQLTGTFSVTAGSTLALAVDFDLEHIIVPFNHGGLTYFTMKPKLAYYDLSQVAAITGQVNPAQLCQSAAAQISQATSCAYNLIVKAELLTADGSRHAVARETTVDPITGNFTLYPLATHDAAGNAIAAYDVLVRGREMETMLVTGVPVTTGTHPGGTGSAAPTVLQSTALVLSLNGGEYTAQFATGSPLAPLSSGYAVFQQTLPVAGAVPYEVRWRNTDPFAGSFRNPIPLQGATSSLHVAPYNAGNTLAFSSVIPAEGQGAFTVADNEVVYYALSPGAVMLPPSSGTTQTFTPGLPTLAAGVQSGTIDATLSFSGIVHDNVCELVVSRFGAVIDADTTDCSSILSTNGGSNSGSFSLTGIPAGEPGTYYYAYVRIFDSAHPAASRKIVPLPGFIDLRTQATQPLNGSIPGA